MAQTVPSRATIAAHSLLSSPPLPGPPLGLTLFFSASASWSCVTGQSAAQVDWTAPVRITSAIAHAKSRKRMTDSLSAVAIVDRLRMLPWCGGLELLRRHLLDRRRLRVERDRLSEMA